MNHIYRILLFSSISLFKLAPLQAQWERIGWPLDTINEKILLGVSETRLFALIEYDLTRSLYDSLIVSSDNGSTWTQRLFFDKNKLDNHQWIVDGEKLYVSGIRSDSLPCLFLSTDHGDSWKIFCTLPFTSKYAVGAFVIRGDSVILWISNQKDSPLLISIDKGRSWVNSNLDARNANIAFRNGIYSLSFNGTGQFLFSYDLQNWRQGFLSMTETWLDGTYIFADRLFATYNSSSGYYLDYTKRGDTLWHSCKGLDQKLLFLNCDENGVLYASAYIYDSKYSEGRSFLYYSRDSGTHWKQLGDSVTFPTSVYMGSEYIFLTCPNELWRLPKSSLPAGVAEAKSTPPISIGECYPNPATSEMRISYSIPKHSDIVLNVFDIKGKEIATIASETNDAGSYEKLWDLRSLPNGSYILKLTACGVSVTKIVEVVK